MVFIGLTSQSKKDVPDIASFLENNGVTWPNAYGAVKTMKDFEVSVIPAVWVIGTDGKVVWNSGEEAKIEDAIETALQNAR